MWPFLSFSFSRIPFMVLHPENFARVTKSAIPTIVRFYSAHRQGSLALDEQYDLVADMFQGIDGINVAGINCGKFRHFCYAQGIAQSPVVRLYAPDAVHIYDGGFSHESISRWATGITGVHARELIEPLRMPNGRVFKEMLNNSHCVFTMFYNPWCVGGKRFLPHIREVAEAFRYDDTVEFAVNDIDLYKFFNWDYDLSHSLPDLRLYCKDEAEPIKFTGRRTSEDLIDFINDFCGTKRGLNGRLNVEAGVIDEVSQIVEDFLTKGKKAHYIVDMEQVEGTKYYVWVMNEVVKNGDNFIADEKRRLNELLDSGTLSPDKLDEFQIRVNILGVFASYLEGSD
jgi:protein disulfide-isomerase A6